MVIGVLLRLFLAALFFFVAWYALQPDRFSEMLEDFAEMFGKERDAFDKYNEFQTLLSRAFYGFSALFVIFTGTYIYHQYRQLQVREDPFSKAMPYSRPAETTPGGNQTPSSQPYGQPGAAGQPAQPYGQPSQPSQPYSQPAGGTQPYSGSANTSQPAGGTTTGTQPYSGSAPTAGGTSQPPPGGAQPYSGR